LGFILYEELYSDTISQASRTLLATGYIASFTTYSTFIIDAVTANRSSPPST
jgi:CrcB protein